MPNDQFTLWDSAGIIRPDYTSAVAFTNQVGGTACMHPHVKGVFIPFPVGIFDEYVDDPLIDLTMEFYDENLVSEFLKRFELKQFFVPLSPAGFGRLPHTAHLLAEAWVPVVVRARSDKWPELRQLEDCAVIITYPNSD